MDSKALLAIILGVLLVCSAFALGVALNKPADIKEVPTIVTQLVETPYNDTAIKTDIANVQATLDEDDTWEAAAIVLAEEKLASELDDDVYDFLIASGLDVDDEDSVKISYVKDTDTAGLDTDDQDAEVTQVVRIAYEEEDGDSKKVNIEVVTEIEEGEVEDVAYALA